MKTALIIHGAYGGPNENWIPWLKSKLDELGYKVIIPTFPTPENQNLKSWLEVATPHLQELNNGSVLIGHSIGAVFLLSILERLSKPVKATAFVAGFLHNLDNEDFDKINNSFYNKDFDWERIKSNSQYHFVFHGDNDPYVPVEEAKILAEKLSIEPKIIRNGGHLNESSGFTEFPDLFDVLKD